MATLIRTTGLQEEVRPQNGRTFSLTEMQTLIGGYIQIVPSKEDGMWIVCDELGKVVTPPKPVNVVASTHWIGLEFGDPLVGEILVGTAQEVGMNVQEEKEPLSDLDEARRRDATQVRRSAWLRIDKEKDGE